jgi:retron-type reverse transcriptase
MIDELKRGFKKLKNRSPGIDGQTKANWKESSFLKLEKDLRSQKYQPKPAKRIYIEKPNNGKRPISIASTRDKVVQMVVKDALEPH